MGEIPRRDIIEEEPQSQIKGPEGSKEEPQSQTEGAEGGFSYVNDYQDLERLKDPKKWEKRIIKYRQEGQKLNHLLEVLGVAPVSEDERQRQIKFINGLWAKKEKAERAEEETRKKEYNFEIIREIEPAMIDLAAKMKEQIEKGEWSSIMSDGVGGNLIALVLRKIMKEKGPKAAGGADNAKTYFLASGHYQPEKEKQPADYAKMADYLKKLDFGGKRLLVVTQYAYTGKTLELLASALQDIGFNNFDFAACQISDPELGKALDFLKKGEGNKFFWGKYEPVTASGFGNKHDPLSGVAKNESSYSPVLETFAQRIERTGRRDFLYSREDRDVFSGVKKGDVQEVIREKFKAKEKEWEEMMQRPLTQEEKEKIQDTVNKARQDVGTMAKKVMEAVWGKPE